MRLERKLQRLVGESDISGSMSIGEESSAYGDRRVSKRAVKRVISAQDLADFWYSANVVRITSAQSFADRAKDAAQKSSEDGACPFSSHAFSQRLLHASDLSESCGTSC